MRIVFDVLGPQFATNPDHNSGRQIAELNPNQGPEIKREKRKGKKIHSIRFRDCKIYSCRK